MAGLIKNQILKHLSKFVLNLSPSQINLSTLKGEGELTGLELNCAVLTQLLELPAWVRLVSASCNRAAIRIQWTKLKTVPIQLCLDEIRVMIETCDELLDSDKLDGSKVAGMALPAQGYYGFTEKIVDGICVSVNLVHVNLTSLAFTASFQMSRILVESKSPSWSKASLPHTRLKDMDKGEVMVFKELSWQTVRIEARSSVSEELTPLRLITNQARCRITLKKRMRDCAILGVRLVTILDDLLWVLTDDQLKAALHFVGSISGLVKKATETTQKEKAARKLDNSGVTARKSSQPTNNPASRMFAKYDVTETSYHFYSDRIDLHFCDDPGGGRSEHPELQGGGAFQISLARLQLDYYPYHLARGDRKHWVRYSDSSHRGWLLQNLTSFDTKLLDVVLSGQNKTPLSRAGAKGGAKTDSGASNGGCDENFRDLVVSQLSRLMTSNVILRLGDLTLWRVSTSSSAGSSKSSQPTEMLKGDCVRLHLPPDLPLLHLELTTFYYPGDLDFPLPPPCLLMSLNPVTIWFDLLTLLWLNSFTMNLQKSVASLQKSLQLEQGDAGYADVKVELVMPRIIASPRTNVQTPGAAGMPHHLRPSSLQISASKISLSNFRSMESGSRADLANTLDKFQQYPMFFGGETTIVHEKFWSHATGSDSVRDSPGHNISPSAMFRKDLLWTDARDVWHCAVASVWAEFEIPNSRPVTLLDATPVMLWLYVKPELQHSPPKDKGDRPNRKLLSEFYGEPEPVKDHIGVHLLAATSQLVSVQLDHHQLLFLLRLVESIGELGAFMASDSRRISAPATPPGMVVGGVLPQLDVSLILPGSSNTEEPSGPVSSPGSAAPERPVTPVIEDMEHKLDSLQPVMDHSDPLSLPLDNCPVTSRDPVIEPPVKLQLQPAHSNGFFANFRSSPTTANKSKLTSSFNSKMDGLTSGSFLSPGPKSDLDIDTLSVRSDESGDSSWQDSEAGWTMVSDNMDIGEGLFKVSRDEIDRGPSPAEIAEEVYENVSDGRGRGGGSRAGVELEAEVRIVSVLTLHLSRVGLAQVSGDKGSSMMIETSSLATSLAEDQDYQQFQFRFGQSGKTWSESILSAPEASVFQLRLENENVESPALALAGLPDDLNIPLAEKIARITNGSITIEVNSANLAFLSSSLTKVSEWAQDEIIPTPIPMVINVRNTSLQLTDDNPPVPGCPQPPPVDFKVPELSLVRDSRGVFTVKSIATDTKSEEVNNCQDQETKTALELAMAEIRILRGQLAEKDALLKDWEAKYKELSMNNGQATIRLEGLQDEKKSLMDTLKYLQEELVKSGKK